VEVGRVIEELSSGENVRVIYEVIVHNRRLSVCLPITVCISDIRIRAFVEGVPCVLLVVHKGGVS
jgi:hypothetical protein